MCCGPSFASYLGLVLIGSLALGGCSNVVEAADGGGGEASGSGAATSTSGGNGGGGGVGPTSCEVACELPACANSNCVASCKAIEENCPEQLEASVACRLPYLGEECDAPEGVCESEQAALGECLAKQGPTLCSSGRFMAGGSGCTGTGSCLNGQSAEISCSEVNGGITCACSVEGVELGTCQGSDIQCELFGSCCEQFF
jgi:hypothetical protein